METKQPVEGYSAAGRTYGPGDTMKVPAYWTAEIDLAHVQSRSLMRLLFEIVRSTRWKIRRFPAAVFVCKEEITFPASITLAKPTDGYVWTRKEDDGGGVTYRRFSPWGSPALALIALVMLTGCSMFGGGAVAKVATAAVDPAGAVKEALKPKPLDNIGQIERAIYNCRENRDDDADTREAYPTEQSQRCRCWQILVVQGKVLEIESDRAYFCGGGGPPSDPGKQ